MRPDTQGEREIDDYVKYYKLYLQLIVFNIDGLTYNTPCTYRPRLTPHLPPTINHALNNDRKKHDTHRAKPTDKDTRRERRRSCFVAIVVFLPPDALSPPTHQIMSAVVGLPDPVLCHSQD